MKGPEWRKGVPLQQNKCSFLRPHALSDARRTLSENGKCLLVASCFRGGAVSRHCCRVWITQFWMLPSRVDGVDACIHFLARSRQRTQVTQYAEWGRKLLAKSPKWLTSRRPSGTDTFPEDIRPRWTWVFPNVALPILRAPLLRQYDRILLAAAA